MVNEDITTGTELIRIVATDADSEERGAIRFSLSNELVNNRQSQSRNVRMASSPQNDTFTIDSTLGAVTVVTSLDREQRERYELVITARDMGMPLLR